MKLRLIPLIALALLPLSLEKSLPESLVPLIVALNPSASKSSVLSAIGRHYGVDIETRITATWTHAMNGFAVMLEPALVALLQSDPGVKSVEGDMKVFTLSSTTQANAPWGLGRLSSIPRLVNQNSTSLVFNYTYDSSGGAGVDIYVLDTGIRITHVEFEGRATWGSTFGESADADGNGHGTHCAGIAAGKTYGVAKKAEVIAVKVLSDNGSGSTSQVSAPSLIAQHPSHIDTTLSISGIDWIIRTVSSRSRPAVVLIALGGSANTALDSAVISMINAGIHVVVAAGGSASTPENSSPGRIPQVITVGASTISDARATFSNYGLGIDIYAPGVNIVSAWYTSDTATATLSGTSMAAAHVAGLIAYFIGLERNTPPDAMSEKLKVYGLPNVLSGIPSEGVNYLAHNAPH